MGGFPFSADLCNGVTYGGAGSNAGAPGVVVSSSASANTKGSWTQITSATSADHTALLISFVGQWNILSDCAVDIGIGAAASEVVIAANLFSFRLQLGSVDNNILLPINLPAGTRIAARCQDTTGGNAVVVAITGFDGGFAQCEGFSGLDSIGFSTATTHGTAITEGNGVFSSYVQLVASTSRDYLGFYYVFDDQGAAIASFDTGYLDIAIGAAGSEVAIAPSLAYAMQTTQNFTGPYFAPFLPILIPQGSRIAARMYGNNSLARTYGLSLYGVY